MSFVSRWALLVVAWRLVTADIAEGGDAPSMENLLPANTVGFASVTNFDRLQELWNNTGLGRLSTDPVMEAFENDMRAPVRIAWGGVFERLGLEADDLTAVPAGETALALIRDHPGHTALALMLDVTGRSDKLQRDSVHDRRNRSQHFQVS